MFKTEYSFYIPFYLPIYLLAYYFSSQIICFYPLLSQTTLRQTCSDNLQVTSGDVSKNQQQPSTSSTDIVREDQPTNLSGYCLRLDQPTTSSEEKELERSYYLPNLPFTIFPTFVLPVPQIKWPRPEKRTNKRKKKTVVITSSPYKSELKMEEIERTIKLREKTKKS